MTTPKQGLELGSTVIPTAPGSAAGPLVATLAQPSAGRGLGECPGDSERKREKEAGQTGKHPHSLPQAWRDPSVSSGWVDMSCLSPSPGTDPGSG